ncbi:SDR family NAD(P)-dependent oxidoreductase [Ferruginibacter yonginensis]|uniref:SDR family NAD(P)-dependent oxidoreductase n=1 Tax=Ferruginibacter yonginensis TaxID=1310416 RepID=A0ABV8QSV0_9BACT
MNIVITGAARGIGKAIATQFATAGNNLILCARNIATLSQTADAIKLNNPSCNVHVFAADLSKVADANAFANFCLQWGAPDVLVNNAGGFTPGNVVDEPDDALKNMLDNNLFSAYHLTRKLAPTMIAKKTGHIFNMCSIAGLQAYNGGGSYSISKFALNGFSKNLRHELMPHQIKVTTVFPGAVFTDSWDGFDNSNQRIMVADDIATMIVACTKLSIAAVPEELVLRPQLGDL